MSNRVLPPSVLPILASIAMLLFATGVVGVLQRQMFAWYQLVFGIVGLVVVVIIWLTSAINDGLKLTKSGRALSDQMYRWSMFWFIFSEIWFFAVFFGILWYARTVSVPTLAGDIHGGKLTHYLLWPSFESAWPLLQTPDPSRYIGPVSTMYAWGLPLVNTVILLTSGMTITVAHWALLQGRKYMALIWQLLTALLGVLFLYCQFVEYVEAYQHHGLTLDSGIYGSIFYFLTGFHGLHVALGTLMLLGVALRIALSRFTEDTHVVFDVVSWYWHFVDVVWLMLFVFVYWL